MNKMYRITGLLGIAGLFVIAIMSIQSRNIADPGSHETSIASADESLACVTLNLTVFLQGPFNSGNGEMDDLLRVDSLIPLTEPYTGLGFTQVGTDTSLATTQTKIDDGGIVDWVWVELRDATSKTTVVATQPGLLKSNGTVVNYNNSAFQFCNLANSGAFYFVAVRHRNHLGVMTADSVVLTGGGTAVDFTTMSDADVFDKTAGYDGNEMDTISGVKVMHMGDGNINGASRYQGANNDTDVIIDFILADPGNIFNDPGFNVTSIYNPLDLSLNGEVNYQGSGNDSDKLIDKILVFSQNLFNDPGFEIVAQLP